jgi:hypothetical protein
VPVSANMEVVGLKEALRELNKINPKYRRQITTEFKAIADPVVSQAKNTNVELMALSGFKRNWTTRSGYKMFPLDFQRLEKLVVTGVSGKKPKMFMGDMRNASVFFIRWKSPQATLLEMANKGSLGSNLNAKAGPPGRVLWKAWEQNEIEVNRRVAALVTKVMDDVQKAMRRR